MSKSTLLKRFQKLTRSKRGRVRSAAENERVEEMKILRFQENWTLKEIGKKYGITRERVRQLIGNSGAGYKQYRNLNQLI